MIKATVCLGRDRALVWAPLLCLCLRQTLGLASLVYAEDKCGCRLRSLCSLGSYLVGLAASEVRLSAVEAATRQAGGEAAVPPMAGTRLPNWQQAT
jgi:hypothetical protein